MRTTILAFFGALAGTAGAAGPLPPFGTHLFPGPQYRTDREPVCVATSDLDGDGDIDVATVNRTSSTVSILLNKGDGTFAPRVSYPTGRVPVFVALGNLDGARGPDIVVANEEDDTVSVLLGNGNGTFGPRTDYAVGDVPRSVCIERVDGDDDLDVVVANFRSTTISVLLNSGGGSFSAQTTYGVGSHPLSIAMADVDGDHDVDVAVTTGALLVLKNDGTGAFGAPDPNVEFTYTIDAAFGAMDGDAHPDLVAVRSYPTWVVDVYLSDGAGLFLPPASYPVAPFADSLRLGDLDGDGDVDCLASDGRRIEILRNDGGGVLEVATRAVIAGDSGNAPDLADVDDDGDSDIVAVSREADAVTVLANRGNGTFESRQDYGRFAYSGPGDFSLADVDGDGILDAVTAQYSATLFLGTGHGEFGEGTDLITGPSGSVAIGRINGDALPDIVVGVNGNSTSKAGRVVVLRNLGGGAFEVFVEFPVPLHFSPQVVLGDIDGDGDLDLVAALGSGGWLAGPSVTQVRRNNGDGTFDAPLEYAGGAGLLEVNLTDMDNDHDLDLVLVEFTGNLVIVRDNAGDGMFGAQEETYAGIGPQQLATGDLTGDGLADVVVSRFQGNRVSLLVNNGDGSLAAPVDFATARLPYGVSIGDVDGDGLPDIVTSNQGSITVLPNNGNSAFGRASHFCAPALAGPVALADLDSDSDLDVVATTELGVLLNGRIQRPMHFCPADVDGDGYVNAGDFSILAVHFGESVSPGAHGDLNGDGVVDIRDFLVFAAGFGCGP